MKAKAATHPAIQGAQRAIRRALPHLTDVQTVRLAATAELLAFGEDRGKWSQSVPYFEDGQAAQPYAIGGRKGTR